MNALGRHVLADLHGCDAARLDDLELVSRAMRAAAQAVGATVVTDAFHRYAPHGVSGIVLIAESHLSIHTWPETRYAAIDLFTCGGLDPHPGIVALARALGAEHMSVREIARGQSAGLDGGATTRLAPT